MLITCCTSAVTAGRGSCSWKRKTARPCPAAPLICLRPCGRPAGRCLWWCSMPAMAPAAPTPPPAWRKPCCAVVCRRCWRCKPRSATARRLPWPMASTGIWPPGSCSWPARRWPWPGGNGSGSNGPWAAPWRRRAMPMRHYWWGAASNGWLISAWISSLSRWPRSIKWMVRVCRSWRWMN